MAITFLLFSPQGGIQLAVCNEIAAAKKSILVEAYSFTAAPIALALKQAHDRGVAITMIIDAKATREPGCLARELLAAGITVLADDRHPIAHSKVMVIDDQVVLTGSYNWSHQAEDNHENLVVIDDPAVGGRYHADFFLHLSHSQPLPLYPPPTTTAAEQSDAEIHY